jgi:DNA-binding NarL/FixJ family response regulator
MSPPKIKVLIVDDSLLIRDSLEQMISGEPDLIVAGVAKDGEEALEKTRLLRPDVIIMDYYMPRCTGKDCIPRIKSRFPGQRILVFTVCDDREEILEMFRLGAQGYLPKDTSITGVFDAIRRIATGEALIPSPIITRLISEFRINYSLDLDLRQEELRIMNMLGDGLSTAEVSYRGFISETQVNRILNRFIAILQTELRAEAEDIGRRYKIT